MKKYPFFFSCRKIYLLAKCETDELNKWPFSKIKLKWYRKKNTHRGENTRKKKYIRLYRSNKLYLWNDKTYLFYNVEWGLFGGAFTTWKFILKGKMLRMNNYDVWSSVVLYETPCNIKISKNERKKYVLLVGEKNHTTISRKRNKTTHTYMLYVRKTFSFWLWRRRKTRE